MNGRYGLERTRNLQALVKARGPMEILTASLNPSGPRLPGRRGKAVCANVYLLQKLSRKRAVVTNSVLDATKVIRAN
jgi:hypothetical protein